MYNKTFWYSRTKYVDMVLRSWGMNTPLLSSVLELVQDS